MSKESWRQWYFKDHEANKAKKAAQMMRWRAANRDKARAQSRAKVTRLRQKIHDMYGHACELCGFSDKRALTLDHIQGNGNIERAEVGEYGVYRRAVSSHQPGEYRILCMNCQFIERESQKQQWLRLHGDYLSRPKT